MREIRFRAKKIDSDEWVYGGGVWIFKQHENKTALFGEDTHGHPVLHIVKPETVGQFTGLYDRQNKEIWEGDICKCFYIMSNDPFIGIIFWSNSGAQFKVKDKNESAGALLYYNMTCEVIGNVHENPELLQGAKP